MSAATKRFLTLAWACAVAALLAACAGAPPAPTVEDRGSAAPATPSVPPGASSPRRGGYYKDDGPGDNPPDLATIPDAEPRVEVISRSANNPYNVFGVDYVPMRSLAPFRQRGVGSWYGRRFNGQRTSSGEPYDMYAMTAAHPTLPIPSYAKVTNVSNGRSVVVRINDRGPFLSGRIIDLSYTAAWKLGYAEVGSAQVEVELLTPDAIMAMASQRQAANIAKAGERNAASSDQGKAVAVASSVEPTTTPAMGTTTAPAGAGIVQASVTAQAPVDQASANLYLQLGAFSARDKAESLRARVQRELSWLTSMVEIVEKGGLFRLQTGPYRSRADADSISDRIRAALELKPVVVTR